MEAGNAPSALSEAVSLSRAELSGVQNQRSSVTNRGSGVPTGWPIGQSSPGHPQAGGLALQSGAPVGRLSLP